MIIFLGLLFLLLIYVKNNFAFKETNQLYVTMCASALKLHSQMALWKLASLYFYYFLLIEMQYNIYI